MSPNLRVIRVMCSGRVSPELVIRALANGLDGVMILGCHPGECHYINGNLYTRRRVVIVKKLLEFLGMEPEKLCLEWISASEGARFAECVDTFTQKIRELGPNPLKTK